MVFNLVVKMKLRFAKTRLVYIHNVDKANTVIKAEIFQLGFGFCQGFI